MLEQKMTTVNIDDVPLPSFFQVVLKQCINDHHYFEVHMDIESGEFYKTHTLDNSMSWIGKQAEILLGGNSFKGIVTHVGLHRSKGNHGYLLIQGYSLTFLLETELNCASWTNTTLFSIVKEICDRAGVPCAIKPEYTADIEYECQYMESDFDFIRRLARQYHEWLYYDGKQLVFGKPDKLPSAIPLSYGREISDLNIGIQTLARPVEGNSYDSANGKFSKGASSNVPTGMNMLGQTAFDASVKLFKSKAFQHTEIRVANDSQAENHFQKKQQSDASPSHYISCETDYNRITLGSVVEIQTAIQNFQFDFIEKTLGEYFITEITHIAGTGESYNNNFTALYSQTTSLPAPEVPLPVAQTQQAVVISNDDPKKQGRVQVKMNWQGDGMTTSWIRVMTPDAGISNKVSTNRGFVFIPEKDDIVLVGFRYDDPKRPFVMGSLFNGKTGTGGDSGNKKKSLTTRSGCTLTIDDDEGSITMTDQAGNSYAADGKGNIKISASKSIMLCVGNTSIELDSEGNIKSSAEAQITETAANEITQTAKTINSSAKEAYNIKGSDVTATGSKTATLSGTTQATVDSSGTTAIAGTIVKLN